MPIRTIEYGKHSNVLELQFGTGDINFVKGREDGFEFENVLIFREDNSGEIGRESDRWKGKSSDELPDVKMVMRFTKPESITALIHSLIELQKGVFKNTSNESSEHRKATEVPAETTGVAQ